MFAALAMLGFVAHNLLTKVSIEGGAHFAGSSPPVLVFLRTAMIVGLLFVWLRYRREPIRFPWRTVLVLATLASLNITQSYAIVFAVGLIPVGLAILLLYLYPILTQIFSAALGHTALTRIGMAGALVAFGGLAVTLNIWDLRIDLVGIVLGVVAAATLALNIVLSAKMMVRLPRMSVLLYLMGCVLVFSSIYVVADLSLRWPVGTTAWLVMAGVVASYCLAISSFYAAISLLTPTRTSMLMNVEPIITIAAAALILGEALGVWQYVGALIVVGAVVTVSILGRAGAARGGHSSDG